MDFVDDCIYFDKMISNLFEKRSLLERLNIFGCSSMQKIFFYLIAAYVAYGENPFLVNQTIQLNASNFGSTQVQWNLGLPSKGRHKIAIQYGKPGQ